MDNEKEELIQIIKKFAESGWDLIEIPARQWLEVMDDHSIGAKLILAVEKAD